MDMGPVEFVTVLLFAVSPLLFVAGIYLVGCLSAKTKTAENAYTENE